MNAKSAAFLAAPLFVFAYGSLRLIDGLDGERGPGFAWTAGHLSFIVALGLFVVIFKELRRMAGGGAFATVSASLGMAGIVALVAQFGIDIVVGFLSADHAAMSGHFDRVQAVPGVSIVVYDAVPLLFFVAQLALIVQLAVQRRVKVWTPFLVLADLMIPFAEKDLMPVGALFMLISFAPIARELAAPRQAPARRPAPALV